MRTEFRRCLLYTSKDDADAIKAAEDAYNALTDYEKSLVDKDAKEKLDEAKAALAELNKPNSPTTGDNMTEDEKKAVQDEDVYKRQ